MDDSLPLLLYSSFPRARLAWPASSGPGAQLLLSNTLQTPTPQGQGSRGEQQGGQWVWEGGWSSCYLH